ncbi:hypothetical protein [Pedobacter gandavensis]|uniref:Erythromycin esterase family protein n=1 Tax=Pedobacter gandavensis TaxID=2679963 RepID=A0ABR6ESP6_9SPHI|nr:hypothetical protein [Pedobacter gandavensis]MBB2148285.1 hypothetical protein [Pedobacter gandavensis]
MTLIKKILLGASLFCSMNGAAQNVNSYLSNHAIDLSRGITNHQDKLDRTFFNHQLFILGEIHGIQKGQDIDYDMITLLNSERNINTYIGEFDFAKAYLLNQYLQTGDEQLIDEVFEDWVAQNSQWGNLDFKNKIRRIRVYNQGLKPKQRIYFEGIDEIHNPVLVARYFKEVLKDPSLKGWRSSFQPLINALSAKNDSSIISIATQLKKQVELNTALKGSSKLEDLRFALKNCSLKNSNRERLLYDNFVDLFKIRNWKDKKLYAFFGFGHVYQSLGNPGKFKSLAYMLDHDENLALKGKILTMVLLYVDSKMMMPTAFTPEAWQTKGKTYGNLTQFNHDGRLVNFDGIEDFKSVTKTNTTTLFNLEAEGSPFLRKSITINYGDMMPKGQRLLLNEEGKYTTDYFQYIVLVRNSEATVPIKNE